MQHLKSLARFVRPPLFLHSQLLIRHQYIQFSKPAGVISPQKLKDLLNKHKQIQDGARKFVSATQNANVTEESKHDKSKIQIQAKLNEHGELDIDFDQLSFELKKVSNAEFKQHQIKQATIDQNKSLDRARQMSEELNFDDISMGIGGYKPVGSARAIALPKKKKVGSSAAQNAKNQNEEVKRPRGRPKKDDTSAELLQSKKLEESQVKRPRGRPVSPEKLALKQQAEAQPNPKTSPKNLNSDEEHEEKLNLHKLKEEYGDLNSQDLEDLREIKQLEKIASIRSEQGIHNEQEQLEALLQDPEFLLDAEKEQPQRNKREVVYKWQTNLNDVEFEHDEADMPKIITKTDFLQITQIPNSNDLQVLLVLPKYLMDKEKMTQEKVPFQIIIPHKILLRIHKMFEEYEDIVAYSDGSSLVNPGRSGSGVAFMGRDKADIVDIADVFSAIGHQKPNVVGRHDREFMFGMSLHLGQASNNYAEYVGIILAQLFYSMFKKTDIVIYSDSMIIVNQVKGINRTKNYRLVHLIQIVHSLAFKFKSMTLEYIPRDDNTIADALSKEGSANMVQLSQSPCIFHFKLEKLMDSVKLK